MTAERRNRSLVVAVDALSWRKSTRSSGGGNTQCVEVASLSWRKSSRSNGHGGTNCLEAAACVHHVALRDSKLANRADYPMLTLPAADWSTLLNAIRTGDFG